MTRLLVLLLAVCAPCGCGGGPPPAAPAPFLVLRMPGSTVRAPEARLEVGRLWRDTCVLTLQAGREDPRLRLILPLSEARARSLPGTTLTWRGRETEGDNFAVVDGRTLEARWVRVRFEGPGPGQVLLRLEGEFADSRGSEALEATLAVPHPRFREWGRR